MHRPRKEKNGKSHIDRAASILFQGNSENDVGIYVEEEGGNFLMEEYFGGGASKVRIRGKKRNTLKGMCLIFFLIPEPDLEPRFFSSD